MAVFQDRLSIRREAMELEGSDRDLAYKIHRKELHLKRIGEVFFDPAVSVKVGYHVASETILYQRDLLRSLSVVFFFGLHYRFRTD